MLQNEGIRLKQKLKSREEMSVALGTIFPNFRGQSNVGAFDLYKYLGSSWGVVVSHPNTFTPVCTSEIARLTQLQSEFGKRDARLVTISITNAKDQEVWATDIRSVAGEEVQFAMVGDEDGEICRKIGITNQVCIDDRMFCVHNG